MKLYIRIGSRRNPMMQFFVNRANWKRWVASIIATILFEWLIYH